MSAYFGKHGKPEVRKYTPHGRTKQSQAAECDINKLLERAARDGSLSHLDEFGGTYGSFEGYDFEKHVTKIAEGQSIFENLPAEIKREFAQSPQRFFEYVTNPDNLERLPELLPEIADRGNYFPSVEITKENDPLPDEVLKKEPTAPQPASEPAIVGDPLDTPTG